MTSEVKNYIDLSDIIKMRFECSNCSAVLELSLPDVKRGTLGECPVCRHPWAFLRDAHGGGPTHEFTFTKLADLIQEVEQTLEKVTTGFRVKLQINAPIPPET